VNILTVGNMYPPHHLGGYELTWRSAVEHLRASGHQVGVLTTDYRNPDPDPDLPEDPEARRELRWYWHDHDFPRLSYRDVVELERHNARVLERAVRDVRPDVVNWWALGGMSLSLIGRVRAAGLPAVGVVGDDWMLYAHKVDSWTRRTRRLGPLAPLLGRLAGLPTGVDLRGTTWLFNSQATRGNALESGFALDRAEVAHPGLDDTLFQPAPEHDWSWRLLYVGRIDERKGIETAVAALAHLPDEARLTVLGSGDERYLDELRRLCAGLGVADRVTFGLRPREELPAAYAEADALLFPTRWEEPWGLVPLEAMAVGTPVVATGTGGSGEYLRDGDNALVPGREAGGEEFAAAVRLLAGDSELRARLRVNGIDTAAGYTESAYNRAIEAALERAVSDRQ
jgi:glycogen(starch) synthase